MPGADVLVELNVVAFGALILAVVALSTVVITLARLLPPPRGAARPGAPGPRRNLSATRTMPAVPPRPAPLAPPRGTVYTSDPRVPR